MTSALPEIDIENVFLYVGDAVRWDFVPDRLTSTGVAIKSIAASIHSPTSFASIISGLHPPQHGVRQFQDTLPEECFNLITSPTIQTGFANTINHRIDVEPGGEDIISKTLGVPLTHPEEFGQIEPPFVFVERGKGGHSPYGDFDGDSWDYYQNRGAMDPSQYAREYREGVENDVDWFQSRVDTLAERGLLDDTLVIYTSDHGELLGERGMIAHSPPIHRRHVEVPTVFINPELDGRFCRGSLVRHVDLVPTIISAMDMEKGAADFPGKDLQNNPPSKTAVSMFEQRKESIGGVGVSLKYESAWDSTGGYVIPRSGRPLRLGVWLKRVMKAPWRGFVRDHPFRTISNMLEGTHRYGSPAMTLKDAVERIQRVRDEPSPDSSENVEVSKEQLKRLGYLES